MQLCVPGHLLYSEMVHDVHMKKRRNVFVFAQLEPAECVPDHETAVGHIMVHLWPRRGM